MAKGSDLSIRKFYGLDVMSKPIANSPDKMKLVAHCRPDKSNGKGNIYLCGEVRQRPVLLITEETFFVGLGENQS
jgi:hypothetical protein